MRLGFENSKLTFPITIPAGKELAYAVCFTGAKPGTYLFPVITWMRRNQPDDKFTNYPVADTAVVKVVEK